MFPGWEHGPFFCPMSEASCLQMQSKHKVLRSPYPAEATLTQCQRQGVTSMSDRRTQRIREQLRQHPNPRGRTDPISFSEQIRRVYLPPYGQHSPTPDQHGRLARQLEAQRKGRR